MFSRNITWLLRASFHNIKFRRARRSIIDTQGLCPRYDRMLKPIFIQHNLRALTMNTSLRMAFEVMSSRFTAFELSPTRFDEGQPSFDTRKTETLRDKLRVLKVPMICELT